MKKILLITMCVLLTIAISYGIIVLLTALGMWALVHLGVLSAWTWKQASLWAIILTIISLITCKSGKKGE